MHTLRALLAILLAVLVLASALLSVFLVLWFRRRYGESGPCPFSQRWLLENPWRRWRHPVRPTLERFHLKPGDTVLELGPGVGYFSVEATRMVGPEGRLLCLDIQPPMVAVLRVRVEEQALANAHPMVGDALNLPLADHSVDAAFLVAVLGEIPDRPRALAELRRVFKPGGVLSISETIPDPDYQFEDSVRNLCRATGFDEIDHTRQRLGYTMCFAAP